MIDYGYLDAYLYACARHDNRAVCSVNVRDFGGVLNSYPVMPSQT